VGGESLAPESLDERLEDRGLVLDEQHLSLSHPYRRLGMSARRDDAPGARVA
jgi:hypothetical protein